MDDYLEELVNNIALKEDWHGDGTTAAYVLQNIEDESLKGKIYVALNGEIAYCEFAGLTNNKYSQGEYLELKDIKTFVNAVLNDRPLRQKGIFHTSVKLSQSGLKFSQKV